MSVAKPAQRLRPIIRVFVSSTFSDMKQERNALQKWVFPKLEAYCQQEGFQFQAIDLRWGVSTEAGIHHRTMRICFEELRRSQEISPEPNFLILLGDRYGWRPLPEEISDPEYRQLAEAAVNVSSEVSDQSAVQVLERWYWCDENSLTPVYMLQPRLKGQPGNSDQTDYTNPDVWRLIEVTLWRIINQSFPPEQMRKRFGLLADAKEALPSIVRFQASATEQEIWVGALQVPNAAEHVLVCFREIANRQDFAPGELKDFFNLVSDADEFDLDALTAQQELKVEITRRLGDDATIPMPWSGLKHQDGRVSVDTLEENLRRFCEDVAQRLQSIIERQIRAYWQLQNAARESTAEADDRSARELEIEIDEHRRFAASRGDSKLFVGRDETGGPLAKIREYLKNESRQLLLVHGESGCGKSALLARAILDLIPDDDEPASSLEDARKPILRFIGITPRSSDIISLLRSLCQEMRQWRPVTEPLPTTLTELSDEFQQHLAVATAGRPVILFLDALDQLSEVERGRLLTWIPCNELPEHAKIVVSCLSDRADNDPDGEPYRVLKRRNLPAENQVSLASLSTKDAEHLVDLWLASRGRRVIGAQRRLLTDCINSGNECCQPLYLSLLADEACRWHSWMAAESPGCSVPKLLEQLCKRLGLPQNHGASLVKFTLGYLAASRYGLSESEILELLFADPDFKRDLDAISRHNNHLLPVNPPRIPQVIWSRLRSELTPCLAERSSSGTNVLGFYHRRVAEWVRREFVDEADWHPHRRLADYFERQAPPRKLDEFLWQLRQSRNWSRLYAALSDVAFVSQMWPNRYFEIEEFWSSLKAESKYRIRDAYAPVIQSPEQYLDFLPAVVRLLRDSLSTQQEARDTLPLCKAMEQHARNIGDHELLYRSLAEQGILYAMLGEHHDALHVYRELDRVSEMEGNLGWRCVAIGGQASTHWKMDDADEAMRLHKEEERLARAIRNDLRLQASLGNQATILESIQQHNEALSLREQQTRLCRQLGQYDGLASALFGIATILLALDSAFSNPETSKRVLDTLQEMDSIGIRYGIRGVSYHANLLQYKTLDACILQLMQRNECREALRLTRQQSEIHGRLRSEFDDHAANAHPNGLLTHHLFDAVEKLVREQPIDSLAIELLTEAGCIAKTLGKVNLLSLIERQRNWVLAMMRYNDAQAHYQSLPAELQRRTKRPEEPQVDLSNLGW